MKLARQRACESECNSEMGSLPACILQQQRAESIALPKVETIEETVYPGEEGEYEGQEEDKDDGCGTSLSDVDVMTSPVNQHTTYQSRTRRVSADRMASPRRLAMERYGGVKRSTHMVAESLPYINGPMSDAKDTDQLVIDTDLLRAVKVASSEQHLAHEYIRLGAATSISVDLLTPVAITHTRVIATCG